MKGTGNLKTRITLLVALAMFAAPLVPSFAAEAKPAPAKKIVSAVCPVMKSKIPDITKAAGKSVYKGKTYSFCCAGCKPMFDKNPEKYIRKK